MVDLTRNSLQKMSIFELRVVGREVGVQSPTSKRKETIIDEIMAIVDGDTVPYIRPNAKGRPPLETSKFNYTANPLPDIDLWDMPVITDLKVASSDDNECIKEGILIITTKGFGFVQEDFNVDAKNDAYMETTFIKKYQLRSGDKVKVAVKELPPKYITTVIQVLKINGEPAIENLKKQKEFKAIRGEHPIGKIDNTTILNGERVLVVEDAETKILDFYNLIEGNKLLINANSLPENFIEGAANASCFDKPSTRYRTLDIVINSALRQAEDGEDVVVCALDIAFLPIAYEEYTTNKIDETSYTNEALLRLKEIISYGKNIEGRGSVTFICGINKKVPKSEFTVNSIIQLFNKVI